MTPGERAEIDYMRDLATRLVGAGHGRRGHIVQEAARYLGISIPTLYMRLRRVGWTSGRKLRRDKGDSRVTREEVMAVAGIMHSSQRANGKRLLPADDAIEIAVANGQLGTRVSPATMLRLMRQHCVHPDQVGRPDPHTNLRSLHPNHCWQLDASICVLYYLRTGGLGVMDERKFNERKPSNLAKIARQRVLRYAITDHYAGAGIARYYLTSGEDQPTLFDFLMHAFRQREGHVMHGVPWQFVWDAGSANVSHGIQNLLTALGIRHWPHVPGNPRAKGQVEGYHNIIERKFEGRLVMTQVDDIDGLNSQLDLWLQANNGTAVHRRHGHTRWAMWQTIRPEQLRLCPPEELCRSLIHSRPVPRTVAGNLTVAYTAKGYEPAVYSLQHLPHVRVGDKVMVAVNPYRAPSIYVVGQDEHGATRYWECDPIERDQAGFFADAAIIGEQYTRPVDTDIDRARKELNAAAWGERDSTDAANARAKGRVAFNGEINPFADLAERAAAVPAHIQRRGTEIDLPNRVYVDDRPLDHVEALFELRGRLGRALEPREAEAVRTWYPDGVPLDQFDALLDRVQHLDDDDADTQPPTVPRLRAVT